jgi:hypothetical protein
VGSYLNNDLENILKKYYFENNKKVNGCTSDKPSSEDIIGSWISKDSATFHFINDRTFSTENLPGNKIFPLVSEYMGIKFNETGSWSIGKDQGQWVVYLDFNKSENLVKGYSTQIIISGSKGIFENKPPWYLFRWEGEEGGPRYKFSKRP